MIKVISINILYFDLGQGQDYIYHGVTNFTGVHKHDQLLLSAQQEQLFSKKHPHEIFPEYYLLKINQFDDVARNTLDEWIYFLKNEEIREEFQAKGLKRAKELLDVSKLPEEERLSYDKHIKNLHYQSSMFHSSYTTGQLEGQKEGRIEGRKEGKVEGRMEEKRAMAQVMKKQGIETSVITEVSGLSPEEIDSL